jgi:N-acetylglucosaminyl-diphospho-decaprenol L-rhamnosyltransferase
MDLSVIIVNWNSVDHLRAALRSIYREVSGFQFEVIVVDNASYDGSAEMVAREFPQAIFVQGTTNVGFARSNNLGYQSSSGDGILFLNPDTEIIGDALGKMLNHLNSDPKIGAVGCRVLNTDRTVQLACVQAFPTILNQVLDAKILQKTFPDWKLWGMRALYADKPQDVEVVSGSCLMVKRAAFEAAGRFNGDYFMYAEDVDLSYSIWQAGFRIQHVPDANVVHHGGSSSESREESQFSTVMQRESMWKFFRRTRGAGYAAMYKISMGCAAVVRLGLIGLSFPLRGRKAKAPAKKWFRVLRWALGLEAWTEKVGVAASAVSAS